jgi:hypothetical protein
VEQSNTLGVGLLDLVFKRISIMCKQWQYLARISLILIGISTCSLGAMADTFESTRVLIQPQNSGGASSSSITVSDVPGPGRENFARRLQLMKQQLDKGTSKGWINSANQAALNDEYANLSSKLDSADARAFSGNPENTLERDLNKFNVDLSHSMESAGKSQ